ncbi:hypothetical protein [Pseudanabaena sp. 'Roaring Creek']|uniref:hypothetical protein n=1 Tax=Pseudanabaena sp. 'Roaring Creek' TaxID=1681830 RepID=UPI0006D781EA|nr:hypothetical protein [Pseudanabaena sp. 'Roaring Creek']
MSLLTSSIDLDMIAPPLTEGQLQFPASQIDRLAQLFLEVGDTVRPIILRRISPISFEILEGYCEYYAAMKAQEIDDQFTAIRAYVVPPDRELAILNQYQFLRSLSTPSANEKTDSLPINSNERQSDLDQIEQTIELAIERAIANRLDQKIAATIERIVEEKIGSSFQAMSKQITNQISQQLDMHLSEIKRSLLSAPVTPSVTPSVNQITEPSVPPMETTLKTVTKKSKSTGTNQPKTRSSGSSPTKSAIKESDPKVIEVLRELNTLNFGDLEYKLLKSRSKKFARPIYELRLQQPDQKFQSILDITKVEGIAEKTMLKIIDAW